MSTETSSPAQRVNSATDLETLIGMHVTGETPEVFWADSHGHFQFATETEAREAMSDPYYQQFLPDVDWAQTVIRKVNVYRPCCSDPAVLWSVIEKASERHGALSVVKKQGRWWASFGSGGKKDARTAPVAVCRWPPMIFATPKSVKTGWPCGISITFAGLRSRWIVPRSCAYATASATVARIIAVVATGNRC